MDVAELELHWCKWWHICFIEGLVLGPARSAVMLLNSWVYGAQRAGTGADYSLKGKIKKMLSLLLVCLFVFASKFLTDASAPDCILV